MARNKRFFRIGLAILVLAMAMMACDGNDGDVRIDTGDDTISDVVEDIRDVKEVAVDVLLVVACTPTPSPEPTPDPRVSACQGHLDQGWGWMTSESCMGLGEQFLRDAGMID